MSTNFLKHQHPHFAAQQARYQLAGAFYSGEGVHAYIKQHKQGESKDSYAARVELAQFQPYLSTVLDSLAGILFQQPQERSWGFLGDPETPGTEAYRLSRDIHQGMNFETMLRRLAVDLLLFQDVWVLVDGDRVRVLPPTSVPNWIDGPEPAAIVKEVVDIRASIYDEPKQADQYVLYTPQGWTRYQDKSGTAVQVASGLYSESGRQYTGRNGRPTLPIFKVSLPWRRYVAHSLAESARVLYNSESELDHRLRSMSFSKLVISGDDEFFKSQVDALKKGSNVLQRLEEFGGHEYVSPSADGLEVAGAHLEKKQKAFFKLAFDLISLEGSVQKTATEVALERSAGLASALAMVTSTMEDADSQILWLLAQSLSDRPAEWPSLSTTWPSDMASVKMTV